MEPLFFKAENGVPLGVIHLPLQVASMEPLFFKAENKRRADQERAREFGFNGAAFFQSGKPAG